MEREDDHPPVRVLHLHVAALPVNFAEAEVAQGLSALAVLKAAAASYRQLDHLALLVFNDFAGVWLKVQVNRLAYVHERLFPCLPLRPAASQGWNVRDEISVLALFDDHLDVHSSLTVLLPY